MLYLIEWPGDFLLSRPRLHGGRYVDALPDIDQQLENAIARALDELPGLAG